jgi:hypothetical protein
MANNTLYFKNPNTGENRKAPVGYSWTVLGFSFFPPIFRSDFKWAAIIFITILSAIVIAQVFLPKPGIESFWVGLLFSFFYNKMHIKELVKKGFHAYKAESGELSEVLSNFDFEIPTVEDQNTKEKIEADKVIQQKGNENKTMSAEEQINSLNNLKEKNLISNDEYSEKKKQILDKL